MFFLALFHCKEFKLLDFELPFSANNLCFPYEEPNVFIASSSLVLGSPYFYLACHC